jgi:hypothetical protein
VVAVVAIIKIVCKIIMSRKSILKFYCKDIEKDSVLIKCRVMAVVAIIKMVCKIMMSRRLTLHA